MSAQETLPLSQIDFLKSFIGNSEVKFVGEATVFTKKAHEPVPIAIDILSRGYFGSFTFQASTIVDQKKIKLGYAHVEWTMVKTNGEYGNGNLTFPFPSACNYRDEPLTTQKAHKIYITNLNSSGKYDGEGKALVPTALEFGYTKDCEGRLFLEAVKASHGFYWSLGMRTNDTELDKKIHKIFEHYKSTKELCKCDIASMYMYPDTIEDWKNKINANPILKLTPNS